MVLSAAQLSWLGPEQATAVTEEQWAELDSQQKQALSLALYEGDVILEHRGQNSPGRPSVGVRVQHTQQGLICMVWVGQKRRRLKGVGRQK